MTEHLRPELHDAPPEQLPPGTAAHLIACLPCREFRAAALLARGVIGSLPVPPVPAGTWEVISAAADAAADAGRVPRRRLLGFAFAAAAAVLAVAVGLVALRIVRSGAGDGWIVAAVVGAPSVASRSLRGEDRLRLGEWLETDGASTARLDVGSLGELEVYPHSRLRLAEAPGGLASALGLANVHRIELARGRIDARILAPPRLFVVDTPEARAVDLGCAYTLIVRDDGAGRLDVTSGRVSLEREGREVVVPAGVTCALRKGRGPGTPHAKGADAGFVALLAVLDDGPAGALDPVLLEGLAVRGRAGDAISLLDLLPRAPPSSRELLFDAAAGLLPPPSGVTREGVLALDARMLTRWSRAAAP